MLDPSRPRATDEINLLVRTNELQRFEPIVSDTPDALPDVCTLRVASKVQLVARMAKWSPAGLIPISSIHGGCILAVLSSDGQVILYAPSPQSVSPNELRTGHLCSQLPSRADRRALPLRISCSSSHDVHRLCTPIGRGSRATQQCR